MFVTASHTSTRDWSIINIGDHATVMMIYGCSSMLLLQTLELEAARKAANAASKTFLRIQQQRTQRFNAAFEHIKCVAAAVMRCSRRQQQQWLALVQHLGVASRLLVWA
jgi:hypothetical protein